MVTGTANSEWHDVIGGTTVSNTTWENFQVQVSKYMLTKVLPDNAYVQQRSYLQQRVKPRVMTAKEWWQRMQMLNRYLRYFVSLDMLKKYKMNATFTDWWASGKWQV